MAAPSDRAAHIKRSHSASPQPPPLHDPAFNLSSTSQSANTNLNPLNAQGASTSFGDQSFTQDLAQPGKWSLGSTYPDFGQQEQNPSARPTFTAADISNHTFLQSQGFGGTPAQGENHIAPNNLIQDFTASADSSAFPSFDLSQSNFDPSASLDPSLLAELDATFGSGQSTADGVNGSLDPMAATTTTAPHLLPEMARRQSNSASPHMSPAFQQATFQNVGRPRNTSESLDPSSAYTHGQNEWMPIGAGAYRHRRIPSDNISDISSHSNQASPYLNTLDNFEPNAHSSPLLDATSDPIFTGDLGLQGISLSNEQHLQYQPNHISPGHSPRLQPLQQQPLPAFTSEDNYGLHAPTNGHFIQQPNGLDMFPGPGQEPFPLLTQDHVTPVSQEGAADTMSPPEINIDYAPPAQIENMRPGNAEHTLSPPLRSLSRNRIRAKSDSYAGSRSSTPGVPGRGRSPSLQPPQTIPSSELLNPLDNQPPSRSPSPGRGRNGSLGNRARSSSHASDQRDYILGLAEPERTPSVGGSDRSRGQKHPATFQCTLCPKKFTRAYNLRSHLRTHTDERPFVCTVCGKAFARQHDRKRHEGLHSGEKKFVCKGDLHNGQQWGCGRRFARADALGRHFRSEAGRVCLKPLLEEEQAERQRAWMDEQRQAQQAAGMVIAQPQPMLATPQMDLMGNFLPAALLQQYPALAGLDWNSLPQGPPPEEEYSGRSSFDASSGGEYYDDMSENEMSGGGATYSSDPNLTGMNAMTGMNNLGLGMAQSGAAQPQQGHQQQHQQQQQAFGIYAGGNQAGDYLSDFEGR